MLRALGEGGGVRVWLRKGIPAIGRARRQRGLVGGGRLRGGGRGRPRRRGRSRSWPPLSPRKHRRRPPSRQHRRLRPRRPHPGPLHRSDRRGARASGPAALGGPGHARRCAWRRAPRAPCSPRRSTARPGCSRWRTRRRCFTASPPGTSASCRGRWWTASPSPSARPLIPRFDEVKRAALDAGALGSSISGAGPTIFALAEDEAKGATVLAAMRAALGDMPGRAQLATVATRGARAL